MAKSILIDHAGHVFNRLTVLERAPENTTKGEARWICRCTCGRIVTVRGSKLRDGVQQSCGCLQFEQNWERHERAMGRWEQGLDLEAQREARRRYMAAYESARRAKFRIEHGWDNG